MTVHSLPRELPKRGRWSLALVIAICAAPVIASYFSFYVLKLNGKPEGELVIPTVELPAALPLTKIDGQPVPAASLKGQWLLTLVHGGACDTACEHHLFAQRQLRDMLGKERDKLDKLWLVSDDAPVRPELLAALNQGVSPMILRSPRAALQAWLQPPAGKQLEDAFYLVDPLGRYMLRWPVDTDPLMIKKDIAHLLMANAGWDSPGR